MRDVLGKLIIILFITSLTVESKGQEITINGGFLEDSLIIGEDIQYWMTATYPPELELLLPDTNYNFSPFEFSSKEYFETKLKANLAFDSAIYTIQSYEIDPIQYLGLTAVVFNEKDSLILKANPDSIYFKDLVPALTDTTALKVNTAYQKVNRVFNYPLMYYIVGAFLVISIVLLAIFGKRIKRYFILRRLRKSYEQFSEQLTNYIHQLKDKPSPELAEDALTLWKKYQQQLDKLPFLSFTTKDILSLQFTKELEKPLHSIDRLIYGRKKEESIYQDFQQIEDFTQHRYNRKVNEIQEVK